MIAKFLFSREEVKSALLGYLLNMEAIPEEVDPRDASLTLGLSGEEGDAEAMLTWDSDSMLVEHYSRTE